VTGTVLACTCWLRECHPLGFQPIFPIMAISATATLIQLIGQFLDTCPAITGGNAGALFV